MTHFNPVLFNCVLLYLMVVVLSLLQSRFRIIKDNPWAFCFLVVVTPLIIFGKAAGLKTWTQLTGFEIWGWTLVLAYFNPKRIVPRINEGYIYAYTLFHWYLLVDTMVANGPGFWTVLVLFISVYPTFLIVKSTLEFKKLSYPNKLMLYYWFLFAISFTYIDQVSLDIIQPIVVLYEVNIATTAYVLITAVQLYFIATSLSLLFVGIPVFHLDRSGSNFKQRWAEAMRDWRETVHHKLGNFVEYQISLAQFIYITLISGGLFLIDYAYNLRLFLIFCYTVIFPFIFFYLKYSPANNLEETNCQ